MNVPQDLPSNPSGHKSFPKGMWPCLAGLSRLLSSMLIFLSTSPPLSPSSSHAIGCRRRSLPSWCDEINESRIKNNCSATTQHDLPRASNVSQRHHESVTTQSASLHYTAQKKNMRAKKWDFQSLLPVTLATARLGQPPLAYPCWRRLGTLPTSSRKRGDLKNWYIANRDFENVAKHQAF